MDAVYASLFPKSEPELISGNTTGLFTCGPKLVIIVDPHGEKVLLNLIRFANRNN